MAAHRWVEQWWRGRGGVPGMVLDLLLWPAEFLYGRVVKLRNTAYDQRLLKPARGGIAVISVGNISVGGAGKTPFAAWLCRHLAESGERPAIVLRGYGRDEVRVHEELNPDVPVYVAARRVDGVRAAARDGRNVAVLDDGFQHRALDRDVDILLVSVESCLAGSHRLLPRGPWRETLKAAERADLVIATRKSASDQDAGNVLRELRRQVNRPAVVACDIEPAELVELQSGELAAAGLLRGSSVLAIAALAAPQPFVQNLADRGANVELVTFPDHHDFSMADAVSLLNRAAGRPIIMTLKDAVKLRLLFPPSEQAFVLRQQVVPGSGLEAALAALLTRIENGVEP